MLISKNILAWQSNEELEEMEVEAEVKAAIAPEALNNIQLAAPMLQMAIRGAEK